jgi:hypothetical protein
MGFQNDHPIAFPILGCSPSFKKKNKTSRTIPVLTFPGPKFTELRSWSMAVRGPNFAENVILNYFIYLFMLYMNVINNTKLVLYLKMSYIYMCVCVWLEWSSSGLRDVENPWLWHPKMAGLEAIRSLSCPFPKSRWCLRNEHDWTCSSELEYGFCNKEHIYIYIYYIFYNYDQKKGEKILSHTRFSTMFCRWRQVCGSQDLSHHPHPFAWRGMWPGFFSSCAPDWNQRKEPLDVPNKHV